MLAQSSAFRASMRRMALVVTLLAGGCSGPTAPSTPAPPPAAPIPPVSPLTLACPANLTGAAASEAGANVLFSAPVAAGGVTPHTITCVPGTGQLFPVGSTTVACSVVDAANGMGACSFTVDVVAVPRLRRTRFMAFGDSVTAGEVTMPVHGGLPPSGRLDRQVIVASAAYPRVLEDQLRQRYVGQSLTVVNAGRTGETAEGAFERFQSAMATNRPEVVLLLTGYNDVESRASIDAAIRSIDRMAKEARGRGARVFVATLTPFLQGRSRSQPDALVQQINSAIRSLAAGEGAVLVDLYRATLPNVEAWIGVDGLHPTEAGYARIADQFFAAIRADLDVR